MIITTQWLIRTVAYVKEYNGSLTLTTEDLDIFDKLRRLYGEPYSGLVLDKQKSNLSDYGSLSGWGLDKVEIRFYWHINRPAKPPMHKLVIWQQTINHL